MVAETYLWLPRLTYIVKGKRFTFLLNRKGMTKAKAALVFKKMFGGKSTLKIGFKRIST